MPSASEKYPIVTHGTYPTNFTLSLRPALGRGTGQPAASLILVGRAASSTFENTVRLSACCAFFNCRVRTNCSASPFRTRVPRRDTLEPDIASLNGCQEIGGMPLAWAV